MKREIQMMIRSELLIIQTGQSGTSTVKTENINNMYAGMDPIPNRPVTAPYGLSSKAPSGTKQTVARHGTDPANMVILGHRDEDRPTDLDEGESMLYSVGEFKVKCFKDKIQVAKGTEYETIVTGETLVEFLTALITKIIAHTHSGNLGYPTSAPINAAEFTELQAQFLDNFKFLAKTGGRF